jgi:hypothetical protein
MPRIALRLALGEVSDILIASARVLPSVAENSGYVFEHRDLASALDDVTSSSPT